MLDESLHLNFDQNMLRISMLSRRLCCLVKIKHIEKKTEQNATQQPITCGKDVQMRCINFEVLGTFFSSNSNTETEML
jgi:hypothetical protein